MGEDRPEDSNESAIGTDANHREINSPRAYGSEGNLDHLFDADEATRDQAMNEMVSNAQRTLFAAFGNQQTSEPEVYESTLARLDREERERPTIDSSLEELQKYLGKQAAKAYTQENQFVSNSTMSGAIGLESAILAAKAIGKPELVENLKFPFEYVAQQAGNRFKDSFAARASKATHPAYQYLVDRQNEKAAALYQDDMKAAKEVAYENLPMVLEGAKLNNVDYQKVLRMAQINDAIKLVAQNLQIPYPEGLTLDEVRKSLHSTAEHDSFASIIDKLTFNDQVFNPEEAMVMELAARTANAAYKGGQGERAKWENDPGRVDPQKREVFNPYDLLMRTQFNRVVSEGGSPIDALIRVGFEINKDLAQYKPLVTPSGSN